MRCDISLSAPYGHIQPQNMPRPQKNTVMMIKTQKRKIKGSDRNSSHSHLNRMEWNQVSTWVIDGCASR